MATTSWIRIIATPPGEAPLWVREQWVGLELPLIEPEPRSFHSFGVISRPKSYVYQLWAIYRGRSQRIVGFAVPARVAVDILESASEAAAAWWKENLPHLLRPRQALIFPAIVCEAVESRATSEQRS
jgi:hypothetical protein